MISVKKAWSAIFKACGRILPPVAYFFMLLNQYLWQGEDKRSFFQLAPFSRIFKKLVVPVFSSYALVLGGDMYIDDFRVSLSDMIEEAYPSILGFAIGLFALVVSSEKFEKVKRASISKARHIAIDMAYPLNVIFTAMLLNSLLDYGGSEVVPIFLSVFNVYSAVLVYDMMAAVYMYANKK